MKPDKDWENMKHTAFSYSFTPKEFFFFLFKKPMCPKCKKKIDPEKGIFFNKRRASGNFYPGTVQHQ